MQKQQGFTLIELMIVVAIIGILAAIAIPQYQNYVARSQMTEAMTLTSGLKTDVISTYSETGACPANGGGASGGIGAAADYAGTYVATVTVGGTAPACTIQAQMRDTDVNSNIAGDTLTLTMTDNAADAGTGTGGSAQWTCTSTADAQYLPESCR
ncbi:type IV pilus structural subunit PilA [Salinisphaera sp. C84B14]|uniref:pilin n=1 Tax=Salinisphaera sp. C84B14 TaxID=1304155 RepID=UPI00333F5C4C